MVEANWVFANDTMADVLDDLTENDWDHVFVVNREGVPMGRIHAVDMLKIVAKKNVRLATDRNRIKRLVREYFRNHPLLASMNLVFMAKRGAGVLSNADVLGDLDRLWRKLNHKHTQIRFEDDQ